ncbi:MAG TPA: hypothetical protein VF167_03485 [Longimicrobiaceae bacterium]
MYRRIPLVALSILALAGEAQGQLLSSRSASLLSPAAQAEMASGRRSAARSLLTRTLFTVGGAVVGAGLGYFTSHVVYNDWHKTSNSSFLEQRRLYSASGAAIGAIAGLLIGEHHAGVGPGLAIPRNVAMEGIEFLSHEEIAEAGGTTVFEVIQSLKPDWFIVRGNKSLLEQGQVLETDYSVAVIPGTPQIITYLDNARLGDVDNLRSIPAAEVRSITRLSAAQAALRLGPGHPHGAIIVSTAVSTADQ